MAILKIELNLDPSLLSKSNNLARLVAEFVKKQFTEIFQITDDLSDSVISFDFPVERKMLVSPTGDQDIVPNYDVNVYRCDTLYNPQSYDGIVVCINGYGYTLAEAIAFPMRGAVNPVNSVYRTIENSWKPDFIFTVFNENVVDGDRSEMGVHSVMTAVNNYRSNHFPAVIPAQLPLYGASYIKFRDSLVKAASKLSEFGIVTGAFCIGDDFDPATHMVDDLVSFFIDAQHRYYQPRG